MPAVKLNNVKKTFSRYWPLIIIWVIGLFLRCFRQNHLLGFYFDQGRDAKSVLDILTGRNFPAIGPTTGIEGLFLGPFWFYLLTPGYFLGHGNPAIAACFISFLESLTIPLIFIIVNRFHRPSAYLSAFLWAFSHQLIRSSRWFSNPSPLPFFVVLIIYCLIKIIQDKQAKYWPLLTFCLGLSLQLEAASAIFFIPVILVVIFLHKKNIQKTKPSTWLKSLFAFGFLLLPQLAFEIKNNFLVSRNFFNFLLGKTHTNTGQSWAIPTLISAKGRLVHYYSILFSKLDTNLTPLSFIFLIIFLFTLVVLIKKHRHQKLIQLLLLWLLVPLFFYLFFVGNYGQLYDYYLTGIFPVFIVLFSLCLFLAPSPIIKTILLSLIFIIFAQTNFPNLYYYLIAGTDGPEHITLGNQKQAVDYICQQTRNQNYNLSIYVPPVTTHAYDYLFFWYQDTAGCRPPTSQPAKVIFSLHEVDPPHPERLQSWLQSKQAVETIISDIKFGGITVQQRQPKL